MIKNRHHIYITKQDFRSSPIDVILFSFVCIVIFLMALPFGIAIELGGLCNRTYDRFKNWAVKKLTEE